MGARAVRTVLSTLVYLLVVVLVVLSLRQVSLFFGRLAVQDWAKAIDVFSRYLVIPFQQSAIRTPYHGFFDVNNALTIVCVLLAEWGLSVARDRA